MIQGEFKRDMYGNYLVIEESNQDGTGYELSMLLNNQPEGILPLELRRVDNRKYYYFNITSRQSLRQILEKICIGTKEVKSVLKSILDAVDRGDEFLLKAENFVLDPEYLFADPEELTVCLCYIPGYHRPVREQLSRFLEYLMDHIDYKEEGAVRLTYGLYQLSRREDCTFADLYKRMEEEELIKENKKNDGKEEAPAGGLAPVPERVESEEEILGYPKIIGLLCGSLLLLTAVILCLCFCTGILADENGKISVLKGGLVCLTAILADGWGILQLLKKENREPFIRTKAEYREPNIGSMENKDVFYENDREAPTIVLYEEEGCGCRLKALDNGRYQDIVLTDFPFFIGKLKKNVDGSIECDTISRFHAKLERQDGIFYLSDLNSTNGTSCNHSRLAPNEKIRIEPGDIISFADISYRFVKE